MTDFGLAKADDQQNLTHTGDILGTLRYMPPEAFDGKADARSDVYSLGLTLYELLAFRPAFDEKERNRLIKQVTTAEPARLDRLNRAVPRDLVTIVHKAIERDPAHRYPTRRRSWPPTCSAFSTTSRSRPGGQGAAKCAGPDAIPGSPCWGRADGGAGPGHGGVAAGRRLLQPAAPQRALGRPERAGSALKAEQPEVARQQREVAQQNLYYAQMHLAQQAWREHRGLPHMRELLANWLPKGDSPDRRGWEWFYLNSLPYQNLRTLTKSQGSGKNQTCIVAWHAASKRLAEGTSAGVIRIWDVDREQPTLTLKGPGSASGTHWEARWFAWSPDGGKLAAGFHDGTVHLWETGSGRELGVFRGHKSPDQIGGLQLRRHAAGCLGSGWHNQDLGRQNGPVDCGGSTCGRGYSGGMEPGRQTPRLRT